MKQKSRNSGMINKGQHLSKNTEFKKGNKPWNLGGKAPWVAGDKNWRWKGGDQKINCDNCNEKFDINQSRLNRSKRHFCSNKCRQEGQKREGHAKWNGGIRTNRDGYRMIYAPENPMSNVSKYVLEHRLIMSEHLDRPLEKDEVVHHINRDKTDNRIENLQLTRKKHHTVLNYCPNCGWRIV